MNANQKGTLAVLWTAGSYPELLEEFGRFRRRLFVEKLRWDLKCTDLVEFDEFDTGSTIYGAVIEDGTLTAAFRAVSTLDRYLAEAVFPVLATSFPYPKRADAWEISRFGAIPRGGGNTTADTLYGLMFLFASIVGARSLVAVTDLMHERHLARRGVRTRRFGPPQYCCKDATGSPLKLVAGEIPLEHQDLARVQALKATLNKVEIDDQTLVLGRSRIPA
jgi:acyl homoserine lactone synthase